MMSKTQYAVAIDGPSGAGKSTLARAAAERLGILYVDTGAIYRTIGLYVQRRGIDPKDTAAVLAALPDIRIGMDHDDDGMQRMLLNGEDVTADIRLPEISMYASAVSAIQGVRDFLMEMQRSLARECSVIMDGRDIGTVVLPDADVKIFLYADVEVRAKRRELELQQRGTPKPYEEVLREMEERDYNDTHRAAAPLRAADDAIMVDTSSMDFDASLALLLDVIRGSVSN
jgi:cytidylate kinase